MGPADVAPTLDLMQALRTALAPAAKQNPQPRSIVPHLPKHRAINVELPGGRVVDALNPPDDLTYSGDDAPPADLPDLVVEPDEAVDWVDDDGQGAA